MATPSTDSVDVDSEEVTLEEGRKVCPDVCVVDDVVGCVWDVELCSPLYGVRHLRDLRVSLNGVGDRVDQSP